MKTPEQIQADLQSMLAKARQTHVYKLETAKVEFTEGVVTLMESRGITQSELAKRIGASPAYITKILRGSTNFTLDTMVKIATALEAEFCCHLQPTGHRTQWFEIIDGHAPAPERAFDPRDFQPPPRAAQRAIKEAINQ